MKRLLFVAAIFVVFTGPTTAHVPQNCIQYSEPFFEAVSDKLIILRSIKQATSIPDIELVLERVTTSMEVDARLADLTRQWLTCIAEN